MYIPSVVAPDITLLDSVEAMLLLIIPLADIIDEVVCISVSVTYIIIMINKPDQCIPESSDGRCIDSYNIDT